MLLPERVLATVRTNGLIPPGTRVLAAVSGGADSVALALVLADLARAGTGVLGGIAHLHHGLRGPAADADEQFVAALAARLDVPYVSAREDVAALASAVHESIEAAGRRARYAFLSGAARSLACTAIATGHTADDQAETLVMRLMRGAGLQGLGGIRVRNGAVIRPLLDARRDDIESYLRSCGAAWRTDASNTDRAMTRNRVRHTVIPAIVEAGGPGVIDALARTAALIQDDAEELDRRAIEMTPRVVLRDGSLDIERLREAGPALARRIVRAALEAAGGGRFIALEHVEAVRSLMSKAPATKTELPGLLATRDGGVIRIDMRSGRGRSPEAPPFEALLDVPGSVVIPAAGVVVSASHGEVGHAELQAMRVTADVVALQGLDGARLIIRSRRPGDGLRPLGAPGRRKLQDVFVDRKIARAERGRVPLVVDDRGRIIWVVGQTIADEFRVRTPATRVLFLKVTRAVVVVAGGRF
ncbi:MAG: tRNA lysidine(34) synthetase TilS [Acidobacteriota bacterium]|nr:tRNA lysidine(34) synthetase TilS [Acidobacteriota bacterium]